VRGSANLATLGLSLLTATGALASDDALTEDRGWLAGSIRDQLDRDGELIPFGKGALFVPSMTHGYDEPPITIWAGDRQVAEATTGVRVVLKPGTYRVKLGSGTVGQRLEVEVPVREQNTTVVPPFWAGLSVHVVDSGFNSLRGAYEIIRVDDREYMGIGFGANEQAGEPVSTWVLPPGLYKIVRVGETYRARTDFATVRLTEGKLSHFLLVMDPATGDFEGAGEVPVEELFLLSTGLGSTLILGGDLIFGSRRNALGGIDGETFAFRAFLDGSVRYLVDDHRLSLRLQVEQGQSKVPDKPIQKSLDRASLDGLYVYHWLPWLGPYVRLGAETNLLPGVLLFDGDVAPVIVDGSGAVLETRPLDDRIRLSPALGLVQLKEGAGVNVRFLKTVSVEATARVGIGARQQIAHDLLSRVTPDSLRFERVGSTHQTGIEATLLATARITRWVLVNIEADSLLPFEDPSRAILDLEGTIALKLTRYLSLNYNLRFLRDRFILNSDRIEQDLLLRFSLEVL
jgi:hypothetical protein